eukprot:8640438-Ditylum_brightwellii.AAC.1
MKAAFGQWQMFPLEKKRSKNVIQRAVMTSPTLLKDHWDETEHKIFGGCWSELFLEYINNEM